MKIPQSIMVLNTPWQVKICKKLVYGKKKVNGLCSSRIKTIKLLESNENLKRTWFHEIAHAVLFELGWVQTETAAFSFGMFLESFYDQIVPEGSSDVINLGIVEYIIERELDSKITKARKKINKIRNNEIKTTEKKVKAKKKK